MSRRTLIIIAIVVPVAIHLAGWVAALGSRLSLSQDAPQYLFGHRISTRTAQDLIAFELLALYPCGIALLLLLFIAVLAAVIGRANSARINNRTE